MMIIMIIQEGRGKRAYASRSWLGGPDEGTGAMPTHKIRKG